jgi:hypothetical protein
MSTSRAIAATTATLQRLLLAQMPLIDDGLSELEVTSRPLDRARQDITKAQVNLFLFQTIVNAAWRNQDTPLLVRAGETAPPPLALNLHYLLTVFDSETNISAPGERLLGSAMSVLHDHPVLGRAELALALDDTGLDTQFERLRITPLMLSLEDLSRLWATFQTNYRLSVAYEVTVVLIDSRRQTRAPLPVLKQGDADRGVATAPGLAPILRELRPPRPQIATRLGEDVTLAGDNLTTANTVVRLASRRGLAPIDLTPTAGVNPGELVVHLPPLADDANAFARWTPGFLTATLVVARPNAPVISSNALAFALAPTITVSPANVAAGTVDLTITCTPRIAADQVVSLLVGDRQATPANIATPADVAQPTTLSFSLPDVAAGVYVVRLRVDGVDSIPVIQTGAPPVSAFDPAQQVTVS